jgi:hypothetical protein
MLSWSGFPASSPRHEGRSRVRAPKTDAGRRIVAIPQVLIPEPRWHLACFVAEGLLFTSTRWMPLRHGGLRNRAWLGTIKGARLGELHFRDLRHQLAAGAPPDGRS